MKHRILEPMWDEVGVLGKGGLALESEPELNKHDAHAGGGGPPHNREAGGAGVRREELL